jgi:hypothetical protein
LLRDYAYALHQRGANLQDTSIDWKEAQQR